MVIEEAKDMKRSTIVLKKSLEIYMQMKTNYLFVITIITIAIAIVLWAYSGNLRIFIYHYTVCLIRFCSLWVDSPHLFDLY